MYNVISIIYLRAQKKCLEIYLKQEIMFQYFVIEREKLVDNFRVEKDGITCFQSDHQYVDVVEKKNRKQLLFVLCEYFSID